MRHLEISRRQALPITFLLLAAAVGCKWISADFAQSALVARIPWRDCRADVA
jgi:hypothetical protein